MADDLQLDFVGKTVARVMCRPDARGLCRDLLLRFSDGTEVQIGATREGFLVVCMPHRRSRAKVKQTSRRVATLLR